MLNRYVQWRQILKMDTSLTACQSLAGISIHVCLGGVQGVDRLFVERYARSSLYDIKHRRTVSRRADFRNGVGVVALAEW